MKDLDAQNFKKWLTEQGYQQSTVDSTVRMVSRAEKLWRDGGDLAPYANYLKRLVAFAEHKPFLRDEFVEAMANHFAAVITAPTGASSDKPTLTEAQWEALAQKLDPSDPMLDQYDTALSILIRTEDPSDVRELVLEPIAALERRQMPRHARKRVRLLKAAGTESLLTIVCPGGTYECAYKRLLRRLIARGRELELEIDFHSIARVPWEVRMV